MVTAAGNGPGREANLSRAPSSRWLRVDLERRCAVPLLLPDAVGNARDGSANAPGLIALRLLEEAITGLRGEHVPADPLAPATPVILLAGSLAGTGGVATDRCAVIGISPLSRRVGETRGEGPFASRMRAAGVDGMVIVGRADRPVYLVIEDGSVGVLDATRLWGATTSQATDALAAHHGDPDGVAVIGPAGERLVRYANVVTAANFTLPRLGFGAVLGAKLLKAIVCRGAVAGVSAGSVADPRRRDEIGALFRAGLETNPLAASQVTPPGFAAWVGNVDDPGYHAVRNFSETASLGDRSALRRDEFRARLSSPDGACPACPVNCMKGFTSTASPASGSPVVLHQETVAALGPNLGIHDLDEILRLAHICVEYGLDPVSAAGTLATLFEAHAAGRVAAGQCGDVEPGFGQPQTVRQLVSAVGGERDGVVVPLVLAEQVARGAKALAGALRAPELAMTCNRVELPPFDPRLQPGLGLGFVTAPSGPRYDICEHDLDFDPDLGMPHSYPEARRLGLSVPRPARLIDDERGDRTARLMLLWSALDAWLICPYASTPTRPLSWDLARDLIAAVTGTTLSSQSAFAVGRLRFQAQDRVNALLGSPAGPARLPARFHTQPITAGRHRGSVLEPVSFSRQAARVAEQIGLRA